MADQQLPLHIPQELSKYFWDVNPKALNPSVYPHFVINRLLDKGGLDAARWVLSTFPRETIVETLKKIRDFSPRSARFWAHYLGVSDEEVACLQTSYLTMRKAHWPF